MTTQSDLVRRACETYGFRSKSDEEGDAEYLVALIEFVMIRDFAMAHELKLGRLQADWTPEDVQSFREFMDTIPAVSEELQPGTTAFFGRKIVGPFPIENATLRILSDASVGDMKDARAEDPTCSFPITLGLLFLDGSFVIGTVQRSDRLALLKVITQTEPIFGWFILADAWIHGTDDGKATKRDAFLVNLGSRDDFRVLKTFPYTIDASHGKIEYEPVEEMDFRKVAIRNDPYAGIFVSVPLSTGPAS